MPESIKIKVELDTKSAQVSIDELEKRIARISKSSAELFRNINNPERQRAFARENYPETLSPHYAALQRMREMERTPGTLATRINQGLGIGAGQNRPNTRAYQAFWESLFPPPMPSGSMSRFINTQLGIGAGQNQPARRAYEAFWKQSVPPFLPKPVPTNWGQVGLGAAIAPFSPWLGSRMLNQALPGMFGGLGGAGGGGGVGGRGLAGTIFGGGGLGGFGLWYALIRGLQAAIQGLTRIMQEAVKQGSWVFQQAAATGMTTERLAQLKAVLGGVGMQGALGPLTANPMSRGMGASSTALMVRAWMSGNATLMMQVMNMQKEIDSLNKSMAFGSKRIAETSGAMQRINMDFQTLVNSWKGVLADAFAALEPHLRLLAAAANNAAQGFDFLIRNLREIMLTFWLGPAMGMGAEAALKKLFPATKGGNQFAVGPPGGPVWQAQSSWEKMGLLISGGPGGKDYARQTAENTKTIADHIKRAFPASSTALTSGSQPGFNLP